MGGLVEDGYIDGQIESRIYGWIENDPMDR